jgi:hypothetical protein
MLVEHEYARAGALVYLASGQAPANDRQSQAGVIACETGKALWSLLATKRHCPLRPADRRRDGTGALRFCQARLLDH